MKNYTAYVVEEIDGEFKSRIQSLTLKPLLEDYVRIKVHYSSLNYKDALSARGNKGVTRNYPHIPGIDAAGIVEESRSKMFKMGQKVIVTGYDLGMNTPGGFSQYIQVPATWVVKLPETLTLAESMMIGTAGFTAAQSIHKLTQFMKPQDGKVLVTGASGGVGSMAVRILSHIDYDVVAVSNKPEFHQTLQSFGAKEIILREAVLDTSNKPMLSGSYQGVVDTVGGDFLSSVLKRVNLHGVVTCCGNLRGHAFATSVYPFILRGIALLGITSASCDTNIRKELWRLMGSEWHIHNLHDSVKEITFDEIDDHIDLILQGKLKGRTIIRIQ